MYALCVCVAYSSCRVAPGSSNTDALFDKELKKYDALKVDVARNTTRNEELLAAVSRDAQVRRASLEGGGGRNSTHGGRYDGGQGRNSTRGAEAEGGGR